MKPAPAPKEAPPPVKAEAPRPARKPVEPAPKPEEPKTTPRPSRRRRSLSRRRQHRPRPGPRWRSTATCPERWCSSTASTSAPRPAHHRGHRRHAPVERLGERRKKAWSRASRVAGTGETSLTLKFKEVRLNASVAVVHKHGIGSCEGRLTATPGGIRYETDNQEGRVRLRVEGPRDLRDRLPEEGTEGEAARGKTWNFTDKSEKRLTGGELHA